MRGIEQSKRKIKKIVAKIWQSSWSQMDLRWDTDDDLVKGLTSDVQELPIRAGRMGLVMEVVKIFSDI